MVDCLWSLLAHEDEGHRLQGAELLRTRSDLAPELARRLRVHVTLESEMPRMPPSLHAACLLAEHTEVLVALTQASLSLDPSEIGLWAHLGELDLGLLRDPTEPELRRLTGPYTRLGLRSGSPHAHLPWLPEAKELTLTGWRVAAEALSGPEALLLYDCCVQGALRLDNHRTWLMNCALEADPVLGPSSRVVGVRAEGIQQVVIRGAAALVQVEARTHPVLFEGCEPPALCAVRSCAVLERLRHGGRMADA